MTKIKLNITIILLLIVALFACTEIANEPRNSNKAPETNISIFPDNPDSINQQKSRLQVHWWGEDSDGIILGYYLRWVGISNNWTFTTSNDSLFSLPIGSADTTYTIEVMAVDVEGNNKYDNSVIWNNEDLGPEPFIDENGNGVWDKGEFYFDIGMIDQTPAAMKYPIKNSPPEIEWNKESVIPESTFPVITVAWDVTDLDGDESIVSIDLGINDIDLGIQLPGNTRLVTLRIKDVNAANPELEVLINGSEDKIFEKNLTGLKLDDFNRLYVRATDISGSKSEVQPLPDTSRTWFVKKPKGELLVVDDFSGGTDASAFYKDLFSTIDNGNYADQFDVFDLEAIKLPFANITFLETIKLFRYIYWYSDATPSLELTSSITQKFILNGGKIGYSMTFIEPNSSFNYDLTTLQSFLPIEKFGEEVPIRRVYSGANILPISDTTSNFGDYPQLRTEESISYVHTYVPNTLISKGVYNISSSNINGNISLITNAKELFFIGVPIHSSNDITGSAKKLIEKVYLDEFGM
jgi:hypothetical protein